jgi:ArsR family transcriptional regulator, arsenate/arsenite/antimonite-responsive transcriptional repressor
VLADEKTQVGIVRGVKEFSEYRRLTEMLKAMAHPSRLMILDALAQTERSVQELHGIVGSDLSTVSRHLTLMKYAGLVSDERQGKRVIYRLNPAALHEISHVLAPKEAIA